MRWADNFLIAAESIEAANEAKQRIKIDFELLEPILSIQMP